MISFLFVLVLKSYLDTLSIIVAIVIFCCQSYNFTYCTSVYSFQGITFKMAKLLTSICTKTASWFIWTVLFMLERENQNLSAENLSPICHCSTSYLLKLLHQHQCYLQLLSYTLQNSINHQPNPYPTCYHLSSEIPSCQISIFPCFASQAFYTGCYMFHITPTLQSQLYSTT